MDRGRSPHFSRAGITAVNTGNLFDSNDASNGANKMGQQKRFQNKWNPDNDVDEQHFAVTVDKKQHALQQYFIAPSVLAA